MPMSTTMQRGLLTRIWCMGFADTLRNVDEDISPRFYILSNYRAIGKTNSKQLILKQVSYEEISIIICNGVGSDKLRFG